MENDFLTKIAHGKFNDEEIKEAFSQLSSKDLVKHLEYLIKSLEGTSLIISLDKKLINLIEPEDLAGRLIYFIKCQESEDQDIREVAAFLAEKITKEEVFDNLEKLIAFQTSCDKDVRRFAFQLANSIPSNMVAGKIEFLKMVSKNSKNPYEKKLAIKLLKKIIFIPSEDKIQAIIKMIVA